jgi:hypothetical protein
MTSRSLRKTLLGGKTGRRLGKDLHLKGRRQKKGALGPIVRKKIV